MASQPYTQRAGASAAHNGGSVSPRTTVTPKNVAFELLLPQAKARIPLRVSIFPHDTTDSIVTTVKNFYGLYSSPTVSKGVSFEDAQGNTLIARYENFQDQMVVYVRVFDETANTPGVLAGNPCPSTVLNGDAYPAHPAQQYAQRISRPTSRASRKCSPSPNGRGQRSTSAGTKGRSHSALARGPGSQNGHDGHADGMNGYTSGDGAPGSSSSKSKEHLGNTEISVENIVEGGRRKRAKFESSELPLFAPPQMPAATSNPSVSPARRNDHHRHSLHFVQTGQNTFARPMQSPQSYSNGYTPVGGYATPWPGHEPYRNIAPPPVLTPGNIILPTPDPTVGSNMSEEDKDVAIQLMRLCDMSHISHGRTSASTLDDTFSGRADAASSTGATSDSDSEDEADQPPAKRERIDEAGHYQKILPTTESHFAPRPSIEGDGTEYGSAGAQGLMGAPQLKTPRPRADSANGGKARAQQPGNKSSKSSKTTKPKVKKQSFDATTNGIAHTHASVPGPMSPASMPASRKPSVVSTVTMPASASSNGDDEPDLSTKPRCQRCRKSKKGCDRQRPCGRCKDAGIPADQCISEDEGNGRKGRYGRHMGVPLKTGDMPAPPALLPAAPITTSQPSAANADKNKKRKR